MGGFAWPIRASLEIECMAKEPSVRLMPQDNVPLRLSFMVNGSKGMRKVTMQIVDRNELYHLLFTSSRSGNFEQITQFIESHLFSIKIMRLYRS